MRKVSEAKITELRRAWREFNDDDNKGYDRLYEAVAAILNTAPAALLAEPVPSETDDD